MFTALASTRRISPPSDSSLACMRAIRAVETSQDPDETAHALARMLAQSDVLPAAYRRAFAAAAVLMNRHDWQPRRHNRIA